MVDGFRAERTVVVDDGLDILQDLGIASVGYIGRLTEGRMAWLKDSGGLRVEDEGDSEEALVEHQISPFCGLF